MLRSIVFLLFLFLSCVSFTQSITLVSDINTSPENSGSTPQKLGEVAGKMILNAETVNRGYELLEMNINNEVSLVMDLNPGTADSYPANVLPDNQLFNGKLVFSCDDGMSGRELWSYDGINPPQMIANINSTAGSDPSNGAIFNNVLYFKAYSNSFGSELWAYDGNNAPTMVADIFPGNLSSIPSYLTTFNNKLYFSAGTPTQGTELWEFDGISPPTITADIDTTSSLSSNPKWLTVYNNQLYFSANDSITGAELWMYDGTNPPTIVEDLIIGTYGSDPENLIVYDGYLIFNASNGTLGEEMWRYDGSNLQMVADISPGSGSSTFGSSIEFNGKLFFAASDINGRELWRLNGALSTPVFVMDIFPGSSGSSPTYFTELNNQLYFVARSSVVDFELWTLDNNMVPFQVTDINPGGNASVLSPPFVFNNSLYFAGDDGIIGEELWRLEGLSSQLVENINTGNESSAPAHLTLLNSELFFVATTENEGREIWSNDLAGSTNLEIELFPGTADGNPWGLTNYDSKLYFAATDTAVGMELWSYDPITFALNVLTDINPFGGSISGVPFEYNNKLVFRGSDGTSNNAGELFEYDPINGAQFVSNINSGGSSNPNHYCEFLGDLYFQARTNTYGYELWKYDGTNPPVMVADIIQGSTGSSPDNLIVFNGALYFSAGIVNAGKELLMYDGINPPTLVYDINPSGSSIPDDLTILNGKLYFSATDGISGKELWEFDGINPPTLVMDINPGTANGLLTASSYGSVFEVANGRLFFNAGNNVYGPELWSYDGITSPVIVQDMIPGHEGNDPIYLTNANDNLYFNGLDSTKGRELWRLCWTPTYDTIDVVIDCAYIGSDGNSYTTNGSYDLIIENSTGCDSLIHLNLIVSDTISPIAQAPDTIYFECSLNQAFVLPTFPLLSDNCSSLHVNLLSQTSDNGINPETITRVYQVVDLAGNDTLINHILIIQDSIAPTCSPIDTTYITCASDLPLPDVSIVQNIQENCTIDSVYLYTENSDGQNCPETITRLYAISDHNGNQGYGEHVIIINDTIPPAPSVQFLPDTAALCVLDSLTPPSAMDNCFGILFSQTNTLFPITNEGLTEITWTYSDGCGNSTSQLQQVYLNSINPQITQSGDSLIASTPNATSYQWINCTDSSAITGEVNPIFIVDSTGSYAVIVSSNNCQDTSECFMSLVGLNPSIQLENSNLYPNPTSGLFTIQLSREYATLLMEITNSLGQIISTEEFKNTQIIKSKIREETGLYFIQIIADDSSIVLPLIKQ